MAHPIQLVAGSDRSRFAAAISAMHADRKTVFVDQLKWRLPALDGVANDAVSAHWEIDEYDRDDTVYLIVGDARHGAHLGSVRLLPTSGPHLLGDKFPQLCADGVPCGGDIFEITRLVTRPGLARVDAERVREHLAVAIVEYGLAHGISRFTMMTHMAFLSAVIATGWDCEPLGLPHEIDGVPTAALAITVDAATLQRLRDKFGFGEALIGALPSAIGTGGDKVF
jgi:N-acyl-L-homoserine lactone synthetase